MSSSSRYIWIVVSTLAMLLVVLGATHSSPVEHSPVGLLISPLDADSINIAVECYPQALPNDGISEAEICVTVLQDGAPLENQVVVAEVASGDGLLVYQELTTDADGVASFPYRSGFIPEVGEVAIHVSDVDVTASVSIPLAPVTYLDVLLVTPEEYMAYLERQVAAAPIYTLFTGVFPDQLAADGGSMASIEAQLMHVDGSPAAGVPLEAELISGEGFLEIEQIATDADGRFDFFFIAGFEPGTATIQVMEPSTGLTSAIDILLVKAGPARMRLLYANPLEGCLSYDGAILPADGMSALPMMAEVTDLAGIPLAGVELCIETLDAAAGWIEVLDPVTDIAGQVSFTYYAGTTTGPVRLRSFIADGLEYD